jgi:hypothetical protein
MEAHRRLMRLFRYALFLVALLALAEAPLRAYTDPGTGIMVWQILVAVAVGGLFQIRKFTNWLKIKLHRRAPERQDG